MMSSWRVGPPRAFDSESKRPARIRHCRPMGREVRGLRPNLCPRQAQTVTRADGAAVATQLFVSTENDVLAAQGQLMAASFAGDCARCEPFLTSDCAFIR